ncbi:hypothetical protein [Candidatus Sodalis pierantonius]|uniref:hypothetical protein n=1 Tax=Candidatus Sodalis pierantonii TaxID=1486991 RepID=UPI00046C9EAB|nr:hypothetical protein [Candidatus Sodalis pierantonius]
MGMLHYCVDKLLGIYGKSFQGFTTSNFSPGHSASDIVIRNEQRKTTFLIVTYFYVNFLTTEIIHQYLPPAGMDAAAMVPAGGHPEFNV